ncbi:NKG2-F type II integral membrane protein-like [Phyllostomus hastatus]|uniref:NKG2-F type II integral membrane protein-like n=1 Tax=Phyllostomus hastatus TaxID=9423 RepID=UPI001E67F5BD|nr:NKG2-F type II integral membrane protein-like [Phyllostomus hastatus]
MDLQRENDSELNLAEDSRTEQRKSKGMKSSILRTEQQMSSVEIEFPNASEDLQGNDKDHCTDLPSPPEKLIAGILGFICFILMYTVLRMVHFIPCTIKLEQSNPSTVTILEKEHYCGLCLPEWFMYFNHCYYLGTEQKTWTESLMACASKNSNLLYIDNKEEMNFMHIFNAFMWIGVSHRNSNNSDLWTNGPVFFSKLFAKTSELDKKCAFGDFEAQKLYLASCSGKKHYACKHQAVWLT